MPLQEPTLEEIPRPSFGLKLVSVAGGQLIKLIATDEEGVPIRGGNLLAINRTGEVTLYTGITHRLGIPLDDRGRLRTTTRGE